MQVQRVVAAVRPGSVTTGQHTDWIMISFARWLIRAAAGVQGHRTMGLTDRIWPVAIETGGSGG